MLCRSLLFPCHIRPLHAHISLNPTERPFSQCNAIQSSMSDSMLYVLILMKYVIALSSVLIVFFHGKTPRVCNLLYWSIPCYKCTFCEFHLQITWNIWFTYLANLEVGGLSTHTSCDHCEVIGITTLYRVCIPYRKIYELYSKKSNWCIVLKSACQGKYWHHALYFVINDEQSKGQGLHVV